MKKVTVVIVLTALVSFGAFAQVSDTATLNLQGTVGPFVDITVWAAPAATSLGLQVAVSPASPVQVGTATISSNTAYVVSVASSNSFEFSNGTDGLPYTLHWNGSPVTNPSALENGASGVANASRTIGVSYAAAPGTAEVGTYTDTLTFTISSN